MAHATVHLERRVVVEHDAMHQRQSQAGALADRFGREERIEDPPINTFAAANG
jgi:hypothetical protein